MGSGFIGFRVLGLWVQGFRDCAGEEPLLGLKVGGF